MTPEEEKENIMRVAKKMPDCEPGDEKETEFFRALVTDLSDTGVTLAAIAEFCGVQERQVFNWKKDGDRPKGMAAVKLFLLHGKHCSANKIQPVSLELSDITANRADATYNGPAVYFLWLQGEIVYIGQARKLAVRLAEHYRSKVFDQVSFVVCKEQSLDRVERLAIIRYQPTLNKRYMNYSVVSSAL